MAASIEDILLLKAQQDAVNREDNGLAASAGALVGAVGGTAAMTPVHAVGQMSLKLKDRLAAGQGLTRSTGMQMRDRMRPGARMAGGLVGAMLGGALGPGVRQMAIGESEAASLLAKLQTGGLTYQEERDLERVLSDTYGSIIGG